MEGVYHQMRPKCFWKVNTKFNAFSKNRDTCLQNDGLANLKTRVILIIMSHIFATSIKRKKVKNVIHAKMKKNV